MAACTNAATVTPWSRAWVPQLQVYLGIERNEDQLLAEPALGVV